MPENRSARDLPFYRLEQAEQCLKTALDVYNLGDLKATANRSYYCIFHCMRAVLATKQLDSRKHSGVISLFRHEFIKSGAFPSSLSRVIDDAFDLRGSSDYDDFYIAPKEAILRQLNDAEQFLTATKDYLTNLYKD